MPLYRSKQPINTDKQFIFTCDTTNLQTDSDFWVAFGLVDSKKDITACNLSELIEKMSALVVIDASNQSLPDEYVANSTKIIKNEVTEENKSFTFLDKECIWLGPVKLQSEDKKVYEKISVFNDEKNTYTDENGATYVATPADKYSINSETGYCELNNTKVVITTSYENSVRQNNIKYNTGYKFGQKKIKLTISKNGIVSLYEQTNNDYGKLSDFKFSYTDKNNMYLYIASNQNIFKNSAVSFVESSETS